MLHNLYIYCFLIIIILTPKLEYTFVVTDRMFGDKSKEIVKLELSENEVLDIKFYKSNFPDIISSYFLPKQFIKYENNEYSDTIIVYDSSGNLIANLDRVDDEYYYKNWTYTCKYNRESKLIKYSYSGCDYCSTRIYDINIYYDNNEKIIKLENSRGRKFKYIFKYNDFGDIIEVKNKELDRTRKVKLRKKQRRNYQNANDGQGH